MHYYCNRDFIEDHKLAPYCDFKWESSSENSNFDVDLEIDGSKHIKGYLDWWQGCNPHNLGIHKIDQLEDEESEDIEGAQTRWDTPYIQIGWDPYGLGDVCEEVQDVGHDDHEEIDLNHDDYESNMGGDTNADEDEEYDDGICSFLPLSN